jgi:hypothetical protein
MRTLILAALVAAAPAIAGQRVLAGDGNEVRLHDSPCVHGGILGQLRPEWRPKFRKAEVTLHGARLYACYTVDEDGDVYVLLEDGRQAMFEGKAFKDVPGA